MAARALTNPLMADVGEDEGGSPHRVVHLEPVAPARCLCLQQTWILTLYCLASAMQALVWMTYGSVDPRVAADYLGIGSNSTDNSTREQVLTWIINEGPIGYIITVFTVPLLLLHPQGLRYAMLLAGVMPLMSTVLRMVPAWIVGANGDDEDRAPYIWMVFVAHAINAMAAPFTQSLPTHVSQTWFGVSWRAFATSVGRVSNAGGRAIGYFIGPALVAGSAAATATGGGGAGGGGKLDPLMWVELGCAAGIFVAVLAYFPAAPRVAPTRSADALRQSTEATLRQQHQHQHQQQQHHHHKPAPRAHEGAAGGESEPRGVEGGGKAGGARICTELGTVVCSTSRTILLLLGFGIQMGAYGAWSGVLLSVLADAGMEPQEASDIGAYNTLAGVLGGLAIGLVVTWPALATRLRLTLVALSVAGAATFTVVLLALPPVGVLALSKTVIVLLCTLGGLFRGMLDPLFFELATEISYPSSPAVVGGVLTIWTHVVMVVVLSLPAAPVNAIAMYLMPVSLVITALLVSLVKDKYRRRNYDQWKKLDGGDDDGGSGDTRTGGEGGEHVGVGGDGEVLI